MFKVCQNGRLLLFLGAKKREKGCSGKKKCFKMNFYTVFMLFSGVSISAFLRQTKNRSAESDFSFG
ncbi:hypothetical protein [Paraprevotella clara]|jgi:hypothetical protein|nr:hypothetical protein [Paraprevotella clara]